MKKSDLIELLNSIPGNPEVKLWNGLVGDWVDIEKKVYPLELVKQTEQHYLERVRIDECIARKDWEYQLPEDRLDKLKVSHKRNCKWEQNDFVTREDVAEKRYSVKTVYALQAKNKGVTTWDRAGNISY